MLVTVQNQLYDVHIEYERVPHPDLKGRGVPVSTLASVSSILSATKDADGKIVSVDESEIIGNGAAYCSESDQFVRRTGRRLAIYRALEDANFNGREISKFFKELEKTMKV